MNKEILALVDFIDEDGCHTRRTFRRPAAVIVASELTQVVDAVKAAESASVNGRYVVGFISYEAAPAFDPALKVKRQSNFPLAWFAAFDKPVINEPETVLHQPPAVIWSPEISRTCYDAGFTRVHDAIAAGETYQANYTFRLRAAFEGDPLAYYNYLLAAHPTPYAAYLNIGPYSIVSNSPELFLRLSVGAVSTEPMKGTIRRGRYPVEDELNKAALVHSEKDLAEHVMIVDLMRSDLGKVAKVGTVTASPLFRTRSLPTVWQMVSTITCDLQPDVGFLELLKAAFPPGSVTGAPKARTMEILTEVESSERKLYCGAMGYLAPGGRGVLNVPIRTVIIDNETMEAECGVGGGITAGSLVEDEYAEASAKSSFLYSRRIEFELLESMLLENGIIFLLDRHLLRLADAAKYFGFDIDLKSIEYRLNEFATLRNTETLKVRLTVSIRGDVQISTSEIGKSETKTVALACRPIDIDTPFVFFKTTNRSFYDGFKSEHAEAYDVLLWNEDGLVTEFTTGNVVMEVDSVRCTPPVACGLLAGTMRSHLIETGEIVERDLKVSDIAAAQHIWLINSVRGWMPVQFK